MAPICAISNYTGEPLEIKNDLKNFLAWFAFEQVANELVSERLQ